jgi:glycosyltransferase involved in cell wall biosynthesis
MIKLSVIIPVYNVSDWIGNCIDSLMQQALPEVEFIFVDDHGTDDSIEKAQTHISRKGGSSEYFRFLQTPQNGGPGLARNVGIDAARGKYIGFVDPDDTVERDMFERLWKKADATHADLVWCQLRYEGGPKTGLTDGNPVFPNGNLSDANQRRFLIAMKTFCVTFIYRREWINEHQIRFPKYRSSEDSNFLIRCICAARSVACVNLPLYIYHHHANSLSKGVSPRRYQEKLDAFDDLWFYLRRDNYLQTFPEELGWIYLKKAFAMGMLTYLNSTSDFDPEVIRKIRALLDYEVPQWRQNIYLKKHKKEAFLIRQLYSGSNITLKAMCWIARKAGVGL